MVLGNFIFGFWSWDGFKHIDARAAAASNFINKRGGGGNNGLFITLVPKVL